MPESARKRTERFRAVPEMPDTAWHTCRWPCSGCLCKETCASAPVGLPAASRARPCERAHSALRTVRPYSREVHGPFLCAQWTLPPEEA
eukprot:5093567-Alexandrium_andersonii.AAC.1